MTLEHSVTKNPVGEAKLNAALEALEAARELQRMRRTHGVNRIELLVDDVDGDWLEKWGEDEILDSEDFQEKLDFFVAIARREEFQKDIQKIEEKIAETNREIQEFRAKFTQEIQRAYQDLPTEIPRKSSADLPERPAFLSENIEKIITLSELVDFQPTAEDFFKLGNAYFFEGRYEVAIANYDKALELNPDYYQAWYNHGYILDEVGRQEEAIASYDKSIESKPDFQEAWHNRGLLLDNLGHHEEALKSHDMALKLKPDDYETFYNRGISLHKLERYEQEIASYDKAIELKPDYANAWFNKACVYGFKGDADQTIENLAKAIELDPKNRENAKNESDFDLVRNDERFKQLLEE